jgi:hypothetical protein
MKTPAANTGLAKVAVQCSADTFVVKIATFAKPETVIRNEKYWFMNSIYL